MPLLGLGFSCGCKNLASNAHARTGVCCLLGTPQAPVQNPVGILHLKALVSLGLRRTAIACGKEKNQFKLVLTVIM